MRFEPEAWLMQRSVYGGLNSILVKPSKSDPSVLVVLCHGYGAPGTDLVSLYEEILDELPDGSDKPAEAAGNNANNPAVKRVRKVAAPAAAADGKGE